MIVAQDFWRSKQTWNGILAIMNTIAVQILGKPEWLPIVALIHGALAAIFMRDTTAKVIEATKENTEAIKELPQIMLQPVVTEIARLEPAVGITAEPIDKEVMMLLITELSKSYPPAIEEALRRIEKDRAGTGAGAVPSIFTPARTNQNEEVMIP